MKKDEFPDWIYKSKAEVLPNQMELPGTEGEVETIPLPTPEVIKERLDEFFEYIESVEVSQPYETMDDFFANEDANEWDAFFFTIDTPGGEVSGLSELHQAKEKWKSKQTNSTKRVPKKYESNPIYFSGLKVKKEVIGIREEIDGLVTRKYEQYKDGTEKLIQTKVGNIRC